MAPFSDPLEISKRFWPEAEDLRVRVLRLCYFRWVAQTVPPTPGLFKPSNREFGGKKATRSVHPPDTPVRLSHAQELVMVSGQNEIESLFSTSLRVADPRRKDTWN